MFLCRQRFYSDLRRLKKLGACGFGGGGGSDFSNLTGPPGQWLQELNVEGCYGHSTSCREYLIYFRGVSVAEWLRAWDTLIMFEATVCGRS